MDNSNPLEQQKDIIIEVRQVDGKDKPLEKRLKGDSLLKLLELFPKIGWLFFAAIAFIFLFPIIKEKLSQADKVSAFGIELQLSKKIEIYNKKSKDADSLKIPYENRTQIINRVKLLDTFLSSRIYKILWVDDNPVNNIYVKQILEQIGFKIDNAGSTNSALALIEATLADTSLHKYDLVISDYSRDDTLHDVDGKVFAFSANKFIPTTPIIFFSSSYDETKEGIPESIYAVAHRADYLINFVLDVVERGNTPLPKKYVR